MILRVTQYGESILRKKGSRIEVFDKSLRTLAADMVETMHEFDGAGLAAQQVDKALLLFVIDLTWHEQLNELPYTLDGRHPPLDLLMPMVFVNAHVVPLKGGTSCAEEGCLSFPDIRGDVTRPDRVRCTYQDLDGAEHVLEAGDWLARVLQHECDHTNGVLFIDHMDSEQLRAIDSRLRRLRKSSKQGTPAHNGRLQQY
jgi:peptide deformylase